MKEADTAGRVLGDGKRTFDTKLPRYLHRLTMPTLLDLGQTGSTDADGTTQDVGEGAAERDGEACSTTPAISCSTRRRPPSRRSPRSSGSGTRADVDGDG